MKATVCQNSSAMRQYGRNKKKNLFHGYRTHKLYDMMLTGLLRRCCRRVAGQKA